MQVLRHLLLHQGLENGIWSFPNDLANERGTICAVVALGPKEPAARAYSHRKLDSLAKASQSSDD